MSSALSTRSSTASQSSVSTSSPLPTASNTAAASSSPSLGSGAIAGIVVGAVLVVLAIIGVWFFIAKRRKRDTTVERYRVLELGTDAKIAYAHQQSPTEIGSDPVVHIAQERGFQETIHELGNEQAATRHTIKQL